MNGFEASHARHPVNRRRSLRNGTEEFASGVDLFLTKPVSFKEVSRLLDEWAERGLRDKESRSPSPSAS
jgi:hypothetical protein